MHTSIIYVTKKVIHWGANHPKVDALKKVTNRCCFQRKEAE